MDVRVGPWRRLSAKELMFLNCGVQEDFRILLAARRSNQSILKEINPEYSLEGLILKLTFQYFGHLMWRADSLEMTRVLEKIEGKRRRGWQRMRWLDGITNSMDMSLSNSGSWWWREKPSGLYSQGHKESDMTKWLSSFFGNPIINLAYCNCIVLGFKYIEKHYLFKINVCILIGG